VVLTGGLWLAAGLVLLLAPFLVTAQGQVRGLLPNLLHPTPLFQCVLMFGSLLPGAWLLFDPATRPDRRTRGVSMLLGVLLPLLAVGAILATAGDQRALAVQRWLAHPWTLLAVGALGGAFVGRLWQGGGGPAERAALGAAALGCVLVLGPELVALHDSFGTRMNTVFKLYYQAWLLLGLACATGLATAWHDPSRGRRLAARAGAALAAAGLVFTAGAVWDVTGGFSSTSPTLDALAHVPQDERIVIDWVRANVEPGVTVLQAPGRSYVAEESRLSAATARPTLLGWDGHEVQWRGPAYAEMASGRVEAAAAVYGAPDRTALLQALDAWRIRYVLVGPVERQRYGLEDAAERRMGEALDAVMARGAVRLYRRRTVE
jgi:uncharacterized membrane protein